MISAEIVADSICHGRRITTLQLKYPRWIHQEFLTHRMFSRNASSSRAIPVKKELERVHTEPVLPHYIGKNQPGMQANEKFAGKEKDDILHRLYALGLEVAHQIEELNTEYGIHKQVLNRYLEPWQHINVVVTATDWENFFNLRDNNAAEPHIHELAWKMRHAMMASTPMKLDPGQWHLPYWTEDMDRFHEYSQRLICVARCARVSYRNHSNETDFDKDFELAKRLYDSGHWSPFEHVAQAIGNISDNIYPDYYANFCGWQSLRENRRFVNLNY